MELLSEYNRQILKLVEDYNEHLSETSSEFFGVSLSGEVKKESGGGLMYFSKIPRNRLRDLLEDAVYLLHKIGLEGEYEVKLNFINMDPSTVTYSSWHLSRYSKETYIVFSFPRNTRVPIAEMELLTPSGRFYSVTVAYAHGVLLEGQEGRIHQILDFEIPVDRKGPNRKLVGRHHYYLPLSKFKESHFPDLYRDPDALSQVLKATRVFPSQYGVQLAIENNKDREVRGSYTNLTILKEAKEPFPLRLPHDDWPRPLRSFLGLSFYLEFKAYK